MTLDEYNAVCKGLTGTTHVVQWGGSHVWKVGGKIFAISDLGTGPDKAEPGVDGAIAVAFKCGDMSYRMLTELPGIIPAPYLARAKWVRVEPDAEFSDADRTSYLTEAYRIISAKLTKKLQAELGLIQAKD
ncbi:MAG: MmcQ/YjbR family DNA-binding protein [Hyphomicrobiales bacterium]